MQNNMIDDKRRQQTFLDAMKLKDGTPIVSADMLDWLIGQGFFMKPAAIKYHGNYTGGLFDHSFEVMEDLVEMTEKFNIPWMNKRSPYIVGMFHDLCKLDDYVDENAVDTVVMGTGSPISKNPKWTCNSNQILKGHGEKSIILLSQFMTLTEEEIMCIRFHMGTYETDDWDAYDKAIKKYESVLWTHTADMYASKVKGV
jgi:HD superfamily phosphohydrolase YqeK